METERIKSRWKQKISAEFFQQNTDTNHSLFVHKGDLKVILLRSMVTVLGGEEKYRDDSSQKTQAIKTTFLKNVYIVLKGLWKMQRNTGLVGEAFPNKARLDRS